MKNAEKKDTGTRAISTGVLTNSVFFHFCVSLKFALFAENTIKIGASSQKRKTQKKNKNPSVKNWSKYVWTSFNTRIGSFVLLLFLLFFVFEKILLFPQGERDFQKQKTWTNF